MAVQYRADAIERATASQAQTDARDASTQSLGSGNAYTPQYADPELTAAARPRRLRPGARSPQLPRMGPAASFPTIRTRRTWVILQYLPIYWQPCSTTPHTDLVTWTAP